MNDQDFLHAHTALLCQSYERWTGLPLIIQAEGKSVAESLFEADFAVVSHGTESDPIFNYANRAAMGLFEMTWQEITCLPSRHSAEPMLREERANFLARVAHHGFVDDYSGIRIAKSGRRFMIENATVWNLLDTQGVYHGQAALIRNWKLLKSQDDQK